MTAPLTRSGDEQRARSRDTPFVLPTEQRYPLDLSAHLPEVRRLYYESNAAVWDVERDIPWSSFDAADHDPAALHGAAAAWSLRAWIAYTDIAASEASLVRFCLERGREADVKFVLATRATERAGAAEASHLVAEACGGYLDEPATTAITELLSTDLVRRALHAEVDLDAFFFAHFVLSASLDVALTELARDATSEPVALAVLDRILGDLRRSEQFGWAYAAARAPALDDQRREGVVAALTGYLTDDVLQGVRCPALIDPALPGATELHAAIDAAATAGLGAGSVDDQVATVRTAVVAVRTRLDGLGIALPELSAPTTQEETR